MAKFVDTTCEACFARQNPVSTRANPACMKITSTALTMIQRMLTLEASELPPGSGTLGADAANAGAARARVSTPTSATPLVSLARIDRPPGDRGQLMFLPFEWAKRAWRSPPGGRLLRPRPDRRERSSRGGVRS